MSIAPEELSYGIDVTGLDPASLSDAVRAVIADVMMDPLRMSTWLGGLALAEQNVALNMLRRLGGETPPAAATNDKRFSEPEWRSNPILAGFVEDYGARTQAALQLADSARLPEATRRKARFAMQLMCDAFAPSNVPWLNPGVVKEATESGESVWFAVCRTSSTTFPITVGILAKSTGPASSSALTLVRPPAESSSATT